MGQLEDMAMFVRIVDAGSMTKAADDLHMAKSAVSRRLNDLEKRLNCQLLRRTTRQSSLTDAGRRYYQRSLDILDEVTALNEQTLGADTRVAGTLKMTAPLSFGIRHLTDIIDEFACQYPDLTFELDFSDRHLDLVEEGYELAIRIGELTDSSLQAKRITPIRLILCASPNYLARHGTPSQMADLRHHRFLHYGLTSLEEVRYTDANNVSHKLVFDSKIKANNGDFLLSMAKKGHGIVCSPTFITYEAIASGELIPLLTHYPLPVLYAYAVYPKNRFLSRRSRLLIDFITARFGDKPYWDIS
ncbi:LysR family transcriptional regulator [Shewanella sp. NIFS-20-20]|uniref:LysR family transcriptional regulator n=1 Tax=Shewanella sp. NIFS-20-20 TaxID=2853806 RepID=UPI001C47A525|nr:LysR family transcriptional regulator [Shewanella sp. NIFS-20-20]MBV7315368.1 LysR family transcriptional regulator [Shewanella sp. NIFS-20-20]